ncbi:TSPc [Musa troglodytarum]|uniref:C-terminal processing peptidase n=1 Tax=Musa troglodytarum TaxID=320322 RepID=A0A9E7GFF9_9LILI|nr:TSPc [Musa troglodytarum]
MNFLTAPKPELGLRRLASAPLSKLPGPSPRRFPVRQRFRNGTNLRALPRKESELRCEADGSDRTSNGVLEKAASGFAAAAAAAAVMAVCGCDAPALAESLTVAFPVSRAREASVHIQLNACLMLRPDTGDLCLLLQVNTVQRTLVEAWGLIQETFIDPTFNHQDWDLKLQQTMVEMFPLKSADAAYTKISGMLATLGDPFTRIISPKEYQSFRIGSDGNLQGVGLFINVEPKSGNLVVLSCIEGSPADRAGIHEGDELIEIDGENLAGLDSEAAARKLRGRVGTTVRVKLHSGVSESGIGNGLREVNEGSASASEILAGALHDNGRAILVGHRTFGKGKIQSVTELHDGSALFITVAKYLSPALHDIDRVGIAPDVQCTPDKLTWSMASLSRDKNATSTLESDSCIMVAEHELEVQKLKGSAS